MVRLSTTPDISKLPRTGNHCFILISGKYRRGVKRQCTADSLTDQNKAFLSPGSNKTRPNEVWQDQLILNKVSGGIVLKTQRPIMSLLLVWEEVKAGRGR